MPAMSAPPQLHPLDEYQLAHPERPVFSLIQRGGVLEEDHEAATMDFPTGNEALASIRHIEDINASATEGQPTLGFIPRNAAAVTVMMAATR